MRLREHLPKIPRTHTIIILAMIDVLRYYLHFPTPIRAWKLFEVGGDFNSRVLCQIRMDFGDDASRGIILVFYPMSRSEI